MKIDESIFAGGTEFGNELYWSNEGAVEEALSAVLDDFEEGTRLYRKNTLNGEVIFATVAEVCDEFLCVVIDANASSNAGETMEVYMESFEVGLNGQPIDVEWWSKCLDLAELTPGTNLSYLSDYEEGIQVRNYAKVIAYVPGEYLMVEFMETAEKKARKHTFWERPKLSIEKALKDYQVEG